MVTHTGSVLQNFTFTGIPHKIKFVKKHLSANADTDLTDISSLLIPAKTITKSDFVRSPENQSTLLAISSNLANGLHTICIENLLKQVASSSYIFLPPSSARNITLFLLSSTLLFRSKSLYWDLSSPSLLVTSFGVTVSVSQSFKLSADSSFFSRSFQDSSFFFFFKCSYWRTHLFIQAIQII